MARCTPFLGVDADRAVPRLGIAQAGQRARGLRISSASRRARGLRLSTVEVDARTAPFLRRSPALLLGCPRHASYEGSLTPFTCTTSGLSVGLAGGVAHCLAAAVRHAPRTLATDRNLLLKGFRHAAHTRCNGFWRTKRKADAQSTVSRPKAAIRLITTQKWLKCWCILTLVPGGYQPSNC